MKTRYFRVVRIEIRYLRRAHQVIFVAQWLWLETPVLLGNCTTGVDLCCGRNQNRQPTLAARRITSQYMKSLAASSRAAEMPPP